MRMILFSKNTHRFFFLLGLALSLSALPYSNFALSVGLIIVVINWILEGNWIEKLNRFAKNRSIWFFCLVYFSIAIGSLYSNNYSYALKELRLWLPLLLMPIILTTSNPLTRNEFKYLLVLFCLSVLVATIISTTIYFRSYSMGSQNVRAISPYISHIRLSLMVVLSIFILIYFAYQKEFFESNYLKFIFIIVAFWLFIFLFILQSLTGIAILGIITLILTIGWIMLMKNPIIKYGFFVGFALIILLGLSYFAHIIDSYYSRNVVDFKKLPILTVNGNPYTHDTLSKQYENSNLVWINVCYPELERAWGKVSPMPFNGLDRAGQHFDLTLIRYLSSKGLSKDSVGVSKLDSIDIKLIENSVASVIYREHKTGIYPRIYQIMWEIDSYLTRDAVGGSSIIQRFIYLKASFYVIKSNILFGVGSGDGKDSLNEYYRTNCSNLESKYWNISHNQYLTVWIASGLVGLLLFILGLVYPLFYEKKYKVFLCFVFHFLILVSMLNEDTFETHIGVSFASLFYAILFFGYDFEQEKSE